MKNHVFIICFLFLVLPLNIKAAPIEVSVCQSGCNGTNMNEAFRHLSGINQNSEIVVNYIDNNSYNEGSILIGEIKSIILNFNNATVNFDEFDIEDMDKVSINGGTINMTGNLGIGYHDINDLIIRNTVINSSKISLRNINNKIEIENMDINCESGEFSSINSFKMIDSNFIFEEVIFNNITDSEITNSKIKTDNFQYSGLNSNGNIYDKIINKDFLSKKIKFENVLFDISEYFGLLLGEYNIIDCDIKSNVLVAFGNYFLSNNKLKGISSSSDAAATNVYIYQNNILEQSAKRLYLTTSDLNETTTNYFLQGNIIETQVNDILFGMGISESDINKIYYYQEIERFITENLKIKDLEEEFINTYEGGRGYDDIKDLPIEWKSENEGIAKLENGIIIPLQEKKVNIIGTRGNDIYIIKLIPEKEEQKKETIPEKIDKMTIKVPITGSKIKAWVLIVGGILLGIIGICSYMLIKRKK